ncbi:alpha/beta hydrolase [Lentzea sp. BCCO 10_0798]|uniref:Alpha/beta hydrolase n=1 Tax=Lentzea kristufekii TaxID=3095430 RepID=A0ABU4TM31_9PSEU|nr:alpha/beta hydrolase [Lentzea sp. BCCO 10_0798]MDX8049124.1 alpha/beta hydrolase [Lentzea sp. BCCO 10_0798]
MSYTDPESLYGRLASGDVGRIAAAADPITGAISAVGRAGESVASGGKTAVSNWTGDAASKFTARAQLSATAAKTAAERLGAGVDIVQAASRAYGQMRGAADQAIGVWRGRPPGMDEEQTRTLANQVNEHLNKVKSGYNDVLRSYASALTKIPPGFEESARTDGGWGRAAQRGGAGGALPPVPPPGTDPKAVADWWNKLSQSEKDALLASKYQELGQLRGLPAEVLDKANRQRISDDKGRFKAQREDLERQLAERARELGVDPTSSEGQRALRNDPQGSQLMSEFDEAARREKNANDADKALRDARDLGNENGKRPYVLYWSPDGPGAKQGALAISYGNPDTAKNLAVCVPGTTSELSSFSQAQAANLSQAMGPDGAAIQWLGYDAPAAALGQVNDPAQAIEGGRILAADVEGYRVANPNAHVTVIGHSYGSTVVGYSAMDNGLKADDIAFVGSPGVGASNVNQLGPGAGHVYVGGTEHDPVIQGTSGDWFTKDGSSTGPYDKSFGATQFGTSGEDWIGHAHSAYYDKDSESLNNLAKIATGQGGEVTEQRWQDSPVPVEVPGSDLPGVGPVIDWGVNTGKEVVDMGEDVWRGGGQVVDDISNGRWGDAAGHAVDTVGEVASDAGDVVVDTVGNAVELGRDVVEGVGGAVKTIGSWF